MDYIYFNIAAGSPAADIIKEWDDSIEKHRDWIRGFILRHNLGDVEWVGMENSVVGFSPVSSKAIMTGMERGVQLNSWLTAHPLWRLTHQRRGISYVVPRKSTTEEKILAKEWARRPKVLASEAITNKLTGLTNFADMTHRMTLYSAGWRLRADGSILFTMPYFATKSDKWKPVKGIKMGNQNKLRDEWNKK